MNVRATELRKGMVLLKDDQLLVITDYSHSTPGNLRAVIQVKVKNMATGQVSAFRPNAGDSFDTAFLEKKKCQYLYAEANGDYVFMDTDTFEQHHLPQDLVKDKMAFVKESDEVQVTFHETTALGLELPTNVVLEVVESELAVKGNSATGVKKDAKLETGHTLKVPMHIAVGEKITVNTDTGEFMGRSKE
ncbi:MAG: elongation factor P [Planctomycetes bacterium]|mgnify:CR=1 FL=1|nr:elongation factor P [Planctomycetota bacterium]HRV82519.1 elongation factor P [Planctomycetota bacterium]